ncbi:MAG: ETC complex I subunit [Erythrobacter sp.]|uniref:NADH dehydrogenase ubiquinone Fe-S protein 4 n=1 Tax=Erythrobacter sp. TaxID=1042 RepID=UPI001B1F551F|nr:ETC complex I subunit [Erythrobacter sp.]
MAPKKRKALGHNLPSRHARQPGTNLVGNEVPSALIYRETKSVMQGGSRKRPWVLEFPASRPLSADPLTGWTRNDDPYRHIRLTFPDCDSAVAFAERQEWDYAVRHTNSDSSSSCN